MSTESREIHIPLGTNQLQGLLAIPKDAKGIVIFAHGSGSSRFSVRNQEVARRLNESKIATLLFDLLTADEEVTDSHDGRYRFNIALLANRLERVTKWIRNYPTTAHLPISYFGSSTGAAAAIVSAAEMPETISSIVSRGGRTDLAGVGALNELRAPILMIAGGEDIEIQNLNMLSAKELRVSHKLEIIEGASHLFEEGNSLEKVSDLAGEWFSQNFSRLKTLLARKIS